MKIVEEVDSNASIPVSYEFLQIDMLELNKSPPTAFNKTKLCHITSIRKINPDQNKHERESLQQACENRMHANLTYIQ